MYLKMKYRDILVIRVAIVDHIVHWPYSHGGCMSYCCVAGCKSHINEGNWTKCNNFTSSWSIWNWKDDGKLRFWRDVRPYFRLKRHLITCWLTLAFSYFLVNLLLDGVKCKWIGKYWCTYTYGCIYSSRWVFKQCCFTLKYVWRPSRFSQSHIYSVADANNESLHLNNLQPGKQKDTLSVMSGEHVCCVNVVCGDLQGHSFGSSARNLL